MGRRLRMGRTERVLGVVVRVEGADLSPIERAANERVGRAVWALAPRRFAGRASTISR